MSATNKILNEISRTDLAEGARLPSERVLAERCSVSRTSIRNALKELQSQGVLAARERSGYYLASNFSLQQAQAGNAQHWDSDRVQRLLEARNFLEPHVTALAAEHVSREELERVEQCLVEMGKATVGDDSNLLAGCHAQFISICHASCPNQEFVRMLNEARIPAELLVSLLKQVSEIEKNLFFADHVNLFQALKQVDAEKVKELVSQLNQRIAEYFSSYPQALLSVEDS